MNRRVPIEISDSLAGVSELAEQNYQNEIPGFQVDATLVLASGMLAIMTEIESGARRALGLAIPFTKMPALYNQPGHYAPHIDGSFRGLAIHDNEFDGGIVELAHLDDETFMPRRNGAIFLSPEQGSYDDYHGSGIDSVRDVTGPIYVGELAAKRLTIFSQGGIRTPKRILQPTVHYFKHGAHGNWWTRYASDANDAELSRGQLRDKARQFRREFLLKEYHELKEAKDHVREQRPGANEEYDRDDVARRLSDHPGQYIVARPQADCSLRYVDKRPLMRIPGHRNYRK